MRPLLPLFLFVVLVLAGCLGAKDGPGPTKNPAAHALYAPDCAVKNWVEPCVLLASPNDSPSKSEIDIVVNPKDPTNVIVASKDLDRAASGCVWAIPESTHDGGKTWTAYYLGGKKADRKPSDPLYGWGCITDPILAFDKDGWAYYALQAYNYGTSTNAPPDPCHPAGQNIPGVDGGINSGSAFFLARTKDGGTTWDKIIPLHAGDGTTIFHDYPRMASNPVTGSTFVIWNQIDTAGSPCSPPVSPPVVGTPGEGNVLPVLAGTRDRGENPIEPVYLTPPDRTDPNSGNYGLNGFAASKVGPKGTLFVTLQAGGTDKTADIWLTSSADDGATWSRPSKIFSIYDVRPAPGQGRVHTPTTLFRMGSSVELAVDNSEGAHKGCLYTAWIDNRTGDADVMGSHSCDQGKTWTGAVRINHDLGTAWQTMVRNTVTSDGIVHVTYLTQAYDVDSKLLDGEYAFSASGGDNWTTQRLTEQSFDGDKGIHQDGFPFFGDYIGIDHSGNDVWIGFPDSVTGRAEIGVVHVDKPVAG